MVTDEDVALLLFSIETGHPPRRMSSGRWHAESGYRGYLRSVTDVVNEAVRTGLVRWLKADHERRDVLVPALVHVRENEHSMCLFTGEDLGPMRSRLVDPSQLDLVDCLECLDVVATGHARGL
jgi:hypothetical protein